ncbi:MAG: hypothetical protein HON32_04975 [Francisellaceae bacterium]|nr:hypothetical protein [Francisellaceae bacterium]MBT6539390.1 hypothetical protein [Francisellaceae bacterium]
MDTLESKLGFKIPKKNSSVKPSVELNIEAISEWVHELPMSDTGVCTKMLFNLLKEINSSELDYNLRFEIAEVIKPCIHSISLALKKHYYNQNSALSKKQIAISRLSIALFIELTLIYKDILDGLNSSGKIKSDKITATTSIFRIMNHTRLILQVKYLLYEAAPENLWQEIYTLYSLAKENGLNTAESINQLAYEPLKNIEDSFKKTLLIAVSNPFQWRQIEQESISKATNEWLTHVSIKMFTDDDKKNIGSYAIDLNTDLPPSPAILEKFVPSNNSLCLNTINLNNSIGKVLFELESNEIRARTKHDREPSYSLHIPTLQKLYINWSTNISRANTRFALGGKMTIAIGAPAAHYYISGKKEFNIDSNLSGSSESNGLSMDTSDLPTFDMVSSDTLSMDDSSVEEETVHDIFANFQCETINVSPTGSCLRWLGDSHPAIEPGEIICMRNTEMVDEQWGIGVIRWLKHDENNSLKIGIQLLGPYAKPAGIQLIKDDESASCYLRSLILPEVESLNMKRTIITPVLPFKIGSVINLKMNDSEEPIKSELLVQEDQTSYYKQFEYKTGKNQGVIDKALEDQSVAKGADISDEEVKVDDGKLSRKSDPNDEFDNIWDDL